MRHDNNLRSQVMQLRKYVELLDLGILGEQYFEVIVIVLIKRNVNRMDTILNVKIPFTHYFILYFF